MENWYKLSEVVSVLRQELPQLASRYHVRSLQVFGSRVREDQHPASDLDLLVSFEETPGLLTFIELENYLGELLGMQVDLVMEDALKRQIRERILDEAVPV
ncbi:nucleotidyltransferase family protein [Acidobacteria bacterium AH-259-O06]|nr:nucleotidyltransferase family protein [Acidobacteria bacterium AH-259-O06]